MDNYTLSAPTLKFTTAEQAVHRHLDWLREVIGREYANVENTPPADMPLFNEMNITPWRDVQLSSIRSNAISLNRLRRVIECHLADASLDSNTIAACVGLSSRYINQLFKSQNTSMMRYVWSRRLDRARQVLVEWHFNKPNLADVAYRCGFNDPVHFSHAFKRRFRCSPREYRSLSRVGQGEVARADAVRAE